ncbi:hypothetical protein J4461_04625 [Candidatus Pacearchaeota archaeon]|nr:hypothetical protein [Candidatus Pacearchaeota archaeon]
MKVRLQNSGEVVRRLEDRLNRDLERVVKSFGDFLGGDYGRNEREYHQLDRFEIYLNNGSREKDSKAYDSLFYDFAIAPYSVAQYISNSNLHPDGKVYLVSKLAGQGESQDDAIVNRAVIEIFDKNKVDRFGPSILDYFLWFFADRRDKERFTRVLDGRLRKRGHLLSDFSENIISDKYEIRNKKQFNILVRNKFVSFIGKLGYSHIQIRDRGYVGKALKIIALDCKSSQIGKNAKLLLKNHKWEHVHQESFDSEGHPQNKD